MLKLLKNMRRKEVLMVLLCTVLWRCRSTLTCGCRIT